MADLFAASFACQEDIVQVLRKICYKEGRKLTSEGEHGPDGRADGKSVVGKVRYLWYLLISATRRYQCSLRSFKYEYLGDERAGPTQNIPTFINKETRYQNLRATIKPSA